MMSFILDHTYIIGFVSFLFGLVLMPLVIRIAKKKDFVVRPNKRMSHTGEVPNIGGLDIYFSVMLSYLLFDYSQIAHNQFFLIGIAAIMAIGFIDDVLVLTPLSKLLGETFAGIAMIGFSDLRITHLHGIFGINEIGIIPSYLISLFVLIAIINAINLIDGIDGLASGLGMLYCLFFAIYFHLVGSTSWSILAICMIGALAVFFIYNVFGHREKIFMGDSGSLTLGFILGFLAVKYSMNDTKLMAVRTDALLASFTLLVVPVFDVFRVSLNRMIHRKPIFSADKNHIHHKLMRTGLNQHQTLMAIIALSLFYVSVNSILVNVMSSTIVVVIDIVIWLVFNMVVNMAIRRNGQPVFLVRKDNE